MFGRPVARIAGAVLSTGLVLACGSDAGAQVDRPVQIADAAAGTETITVTARRREEKEVVRSSSIGSFYKLLIAARNGCADRISALRCEWATAYSSRSFITCKASLAT